MGCLCPGGGLGVASCNAQGTFGDCACPAVAGASGGNTSPDAGAAAPMQSGAVLPCDVSGVLQSHCLLCHNRPMQFGAPMSLVSWDDLHAKGVEHPDKLVYQLIAERIQSPTQPMPPAPNPALSSQEQATLLNWIQLGALSAPAGTICPQSSGGTGGAGTGAAGAAGSAGTGPTSDYPWGFPPPPDCTETFTMHAHGASGETDTTPLSVPSDPNTNQGNAYTCFYFKPPYKAGSQGLWFYPDLDNTKVLHHWILYGTDNATHAPGTSAPCSAVEANAYFIAGWAPGADQIKLPADVGVSMPSGPNAGLILEEHHFNASGQTAQDRSGVRFCTAPQNTRPHTAGVHFTGSEGICLQPHIQSEVVGPCAPRQDMGDIHIVNVWPHMHKLATRMQIVVHRQAGTDEILHDKPFDFNAQLNYPTDFVMHPGDTLDTHCFYNNTTDSPVHFGEDTQDEMCVGFILAWPAGALAVDPNNLTPQEMTLVGFQQQRRCQDLASILQSCNGLADDPTMPSQ